MKTQYLVAVTATLLVVCGISLAQQRPIPSAPPVMPSNAIQPISNPIVPAANTSPVPAGLATSPKPEELTIDQLVEAVENLREQKAELEKKEQAMIKLIHRKAEKQKERIDGLNLNGPSAGPANYPQQNIPPSSLLN